MFTKVHMLVNVHLYVNICHTPFYCYNSQWRTVTPILHPLGKQNKSYIFVEIEPCIKHVNQVCQPRVQITWDNVNGVLLYLSPESDVHNVNKGNSL